MVKVQDTNIKIKKEERKELKRQYTINVIPKGKGFQARVTLKIIGGGKNPRLTTYSSASPNEAVCKILDKMSDEITSLKITNVLDKKLCLKIYDSVMLSIQQLNLMSDRSIMEHTTKLFNVLSTKTSNIVETESTIGNTYECNTNNINQPQQPKMFDNNYKVVPIDSNDSREFFEKNQFQPITDYKGFEEIALEWFKYKLTLTKKTIENPKPLSPKTLQGYNDILNNQILPYFKGNKNITLLVEEDLKDCINSFNGHRNRESVYIVLKMIFDYAREQNYIYYVPKIKKPKKPYTDKEKNLTFIESDRHELWLNKFEEENTDVSLLFETMLLTGIRPEEACGLKWCAINENTNELIINNAYKDFPIYNENCKVIGHKRADGRLKTPESYRSIPLNFRLKRRLLEHKEKQKELFKVYHKKWSENSYMFLNNIRKPYVPEKLSDNMRNFIDKYNLEHMTPYGLRHSFATFCSEQGMEQIVLMRLMGHSDFNTTQKYYICVSSKRKKEAMQNVYKNIFNEEITQEILA